MPFPADLIKHIETNLFQEDLLDLSGCEINDQEISLLAQALTHNKHIKNIRLFGNNISDEGASIIATIPTLEIVNLADNQIKEAGARALATSKTIKQLIISNNPIGDKGAELLAGNTTLSELQVAGCDITALGADYLFQSKTLKKLDLSNNRLGNEPLKALEKNQSLEELKLAYTGIEEKGASYIASNQHLKILDLSNNCIKSKGCQTILSHPVLKMLDLTENQIDDAGLEGLDNLKNLRELVLFGNAITDIGLNRLLDTPLLDSFNLHNNPIYLTTLSNIQKSSFETSDYRIFSRKQAIEDKITPPVPAVSVPPKPITPHFSTSPGSSPELTGKRKAQELVSHPDFQEFFDTADFSAVKAFFDTLKENCVTHLQHKKIRHRSAPNRPSGNGTAIS